MKKSFFEGKKKRAFTYNIFFTALLGLFFIFSFSQVAKAAVVIDSSSPVRTTGTDPRTTASFNPPNNSLILATVSSDSNNQDPIIAISNNGAALTWNLIAERSKSDAGAQNGEASAFYALLPTGRTGMTVTATATNQNPRLSLKVYVITGHDTASPIGAVGEGSSTTNNITPVAYNSSVPGSLGFGVSNDWNALGLPVSIDQEDAFHLSGFISGLSAYKASPTASVGTPVTINFDAFGTGAPQWNWVGFEVKPGDVPPDTTPPAVTITAPVNNATVAGTILVTADASDNVGVVGVQFKLDGNNLGVEDTTAPYSVSWDTTTATEGAHALTATARDAALNSTTSSTVDVIVQNQDILPPSVSVTAPLDGAVITGTININATASDNVGVAGVQFKVDGIDLGAEDTTFPYSISFNTTTFTQGLHSLTAVARDVALNTTTSSVVNVSVIPKLFITQPTEGSVIQGSEAGTNIDILYTVAGQLLAGDHIHFELDSEGTRMDMTPDGSYQWTGATPGQHTLHGVIATASHSEIVGSEATSVNFTITVPDIIPPTVSITAPADGATVNGNVTVTATASDNVAVAGVQFKINGVNQGSEDITSPYSVIWDTTTFGNGSHIITAVARDTSQNTATSSPISVTVNNNNDPSQIGQWTGVISMPIVAVHMALLPTGKVVMWEGQDNGGDSAHIFDPSTGVFTPKPNNGTNLFCSGHSMLNDGTLFTIGGDSNVGGYGIRDSDYFNPFTETWSARANMNYERWYPTATTLSDGRVIAVSGANDCYTCYSSTPEIYNPATNTWTAMPSATRTEPLYPLNFLLPDGRLFDAGTYDFPSASYALNLITQTWATVDPVLREGASAVMYEPGKIMKSGKTAADDAPYVSSVGSTYVIDMNQASPSWRQTVSMAFPRAYHVLTLLPDGTVVATGGGRTTDSTQESQAVMEAEIWNPITETWATMAGALRSRLYHGTALLLPDGRVLVAGGGRNRGVNQLNYQIFSPPYLFKGARPTITSVPATVQHNNDFFLETPDGASISKVNIVRIGSMTHSFNADQRFINLNFTQTTGGLTVTAPANTNIAPPGYYMIFAVNANGVPSIGKFVRFPSTSEDSIPPTAPDNLQATGGVSTASLTWTASTDNVGVVHYNVHRSVTADFVISGGNRIAQPTATNYTDTGLTAGTYYYKVTAEDANANISSSSNEASAIVTSDTNPPTVSITAPLNNATVSGVITVAADAFDDIAVAGVQFKLDGNNLGAEDITFPYSISWDTVTTTNASHTLTAVARDGAGNSTTSSVISVIVFNDIVLAIHSSTPARVQGADPITTAAFNPPDNSLLLVMISSDSGSGDPTVAISNNGTALTWNLIQARSIADAGGQSGEASAFYTLLPTGRTGMTVTATVTNQNVNLSMKVYVVTGHNTTTPIGASGEGSSTTNNITPTMYTSTVANSLGFGVSNDWNAAGLPTSTDVEDAFHISGLISGMSAYKTTVTSVPSTPVTMNFDGGGTGALQWNWVGFEVRPQ